MRSLNSAKKENFIRAANGTENPHSVFRPSGTKSMDPNLVSNFIGPKHRPITFCFYSGMSGPVFIPMGVNYFILFPSADLPASLWPSLSQKHPSAKNPNPIQTFIIISPSFDSDTFFFPSIGHRKTLALSRSAAISISEGKLSFHSFPP